MAVKEAHIDGLGAIKLVKRRGTRSIRLSVTHDGAVRVSMPPWVPYGKGLDFAKQKRAWLEAQLAKHSSPKIKQGTRVGKRHYIKYEPSSALKPASRIGHEAITISSSLPLSDTAVQAKAIEAAERALKAESEELFPERFEYLARQHGFKYRTLKIKKMRSRWGSCSSEKLIALSTYLIQLPWPLIDYVMVHELLHTRHMHHGPDFWKDFEAIIPKAKQIRRQMRDFRPKLLV